MDSYSKLGLQALLHLSDKLQINPKPDGIFTVFSCWPSTGRHARIVQKEIIQVHDLHVENFTILIAQAYQALSACRIEECVINRSTCIDSRESLKWNDIEAPKLASKRRPTNEVSQL